MTGAGAPLTVSLEQARALAVQKQGLDVRPASSAKRTLLQAIRRIGLLQLDSVNVVARSHYLVMLSRAGLYDTGKLDELLHPDRNLFEGWAHAACLIPVEDYPYFVPGILKRRQEPLGQWQQQMLGEDPDQILQWVVDEVARRGELSSKDFEDSRDQRAPWWGFKPAKHALIRQFRRGHLMVSRRHNFQIYYDLPERVLPASTEPSQITLADYHRWATLKGLGHLGVATAPHICDYYRIGVSVVRPLLDKLTAEGEVVPVEIDGWREVAYILPADLAHLDRLGSGEDAPGLTTFLSPFDNLTWNRKRLRELFDFEYSLEIYVPKAKRKHGYYVMPILHQGRFVGRLDPKADRKNRTMIIRNLTLEEGVSTDASLLDGLAKAMAEFMAFHHSEALITEKCEPAGIADELKARI